MSLTWQQSIGATETHLTEFNCDEKSHLVHNDIRSDLEYLCLAAKKDGVEIAIVSSYRSFDRQLAIWNEKWQGHREVYSRYGRPLNVAQMSDIEKYKAISLWSALPGLSRHHWGTDLDIFSAEAIKDGYQVELTPDEFSKNGVCHQLNQWLEINLEKHGFFRPYLTYQQGVSEEPWHISHKQTSQSIYNNFPKKDCLAHINQSDIQSCDFICNRFEHYYDNYFLNICQ